MSFLKTLIQFITFEKKKNGKDPQKIAKTTKKCIIHNIKISPSNFAMIKWECAIIFPQ